MLDSEYIENARINNCIISIYSIEQIKNYIKVSKNTASKLRYHININTGMNNLGINMSELDKLSEILINNNISPEGIYSHFSNANSDEKITKMQYELFENAYGLLKDKGINIRIKHIANSAGTLLYDKKYSLDYVRIGMALYGLQPSEYQKIEWIKNVITWKSVVSRLRRVSAGERINYGKESLIERDMDIAVIPVGYGDGFKTGLSNGGYVLFNKCKCFIKGVVCMDQITVEIPENLEISEGSEVILLGVDNDKSFLADEMAELAGTIADDIICSISKDIPRIYV